MLTSTATARNHGLDFLKGILTFLIVFAHVPFPKPFGLYVAYFGPVSVSVFFMVSGYFSFGASRQKLLRSIKRTLGYLLLADVLYLIKMLVDDGCGLQGLVNFLLNEVFTIDHLLKLPIISQSAICFIAWFLIALLMCYVVKLLMGKGMRILGCIGLLAGVVVSLPPIDTHMDFPVTNPWLWGIPMFTLGELVREHETRILGAVKRPALVGIALLGVVMITLSRYYGTQGWFIGCCVMGPALFLLFVESGMKYNPLCWLGSTYLFFIYIMHPLVSFAYSHFRPHGSVLEPWLRPLIVLVLTIGLAVVYYAFKGMLRPCLGNSRKSLDGNNR